MNFQSIINNISSKEDFVNFLSLLINDLTDDSSSWENRDLQSYLEAIQSWTEDMEGYYENNNLQIPVEVDWKVFANILLAAKMYE